MGAPDLSSLEVRSLHSLGTPPLAVVAILTLVFEQAPGWDSAYLLELSIAGSLTFGTNGTLYTPACPSMWHLRPPL